MDQSLLYFKTCWTLREGAYFSYKHSPLSTIQCCGDYSTVMAVNEVFTEFNA